MRAPLLVQFPWSLERYQVGFEMRNAPFVDRVRYEAAYQWCVDQFGGMYKNPRWYTKEGEFWFADPNDACAFKLVHG
ncbi:MAG: hypothetical protein EOP83_11775 [Verrucomicrobiaceae bacterium]|nr:MAG: hypothetical protein EOP83_11775 [Verrucomicrobiaceae bacterium]